MAYNKKNKLKRIIEIQEIVLQHINKPMSYKEIYWTYIYDVYHISMRTFTTYLGIPAKRDLKRIEEHEAKILQAKKAQLKLF